MSKKKIKTSASDEMPSPISFIDQASDKSLELGMSLDEWLDYLRGFRDELDIQIENVEQELGY